MEVSGHPIDNFDAQSASSIFWDVIPVLLRRSDRDEGIEELSFRLLAGHTRPNQSMRVIRMYIFSESDLLLLHTLEVSEEDFQTLKIEQGILVDFTHFSDKIIDLLKRCIASRDEDTPRFRAVLTVSPGESQFKLVETNDFKQLPHISLCFRPGTDVSIKSFLAFRLTELKAERKALSEKLNSEQTELSSVSKQLQEQQERLQKVEAKHSEMLMQAKAVAKDAEATSHHELVKQREDLVNNYEREKAKLKDHHAHELESLNSRLTSLDQENRELRDEKYTLSSQLSEMRHKFESSDRVVSSMQQEVTSLQAQLQDVSRGKTDTEASLSSTNAQLISHREKVAMLEKIIQQQSDRAQSLEDALKQLHGRCSDLKQANSTHEFRAHEAAEEVSKGNQIIEKLSADLHLSNEKLKRKQAIIVRQEEQLSATSSALDAAQKEVEDTQRQLSVIQEEKDRADSTKDELVTKLQDCKQQLQGNEQMIRWLNTQVNEAQLRTVKATPARPSNMGWGGGHDTVPGSAMTSSTKLLGGHDYSASAVSRTPFNPRPAHSWMNGV